MIGAIIGDIAGSRFERFSHKSKEFELFNKKCRTTDDSVMSLAIAKAILSCNGRHELLSQQAIVCMQELGREYPNAGYGGNFKKWIHSDNPLPYNSYGNGSAMRVSPCGFAANSMDEAKELSALVTKVSHDHPDGMKGAEAIAVAVYMARSGEKKDSIRERIEEDYYKLDFTIDEIRKDYKFDVSCQGSVPVALEAFFESTDFEDAVRTAISVGGDSDTIATMTGSVAEAYYGIPEEIICEAIDFLDAKQMEILYYFEEQYPSKAIDENEEPVINVFDVLDTAVDKVIPVGTTIKMDEEDLYGDVVHGCVDKDVLLPDFSSFDKSEKLDLGEEALDALSKAGEGTTKAAKLAGKGLSSAFKFAKESVDATKEKAEANAEKCYEIIPSNIDDTDQIFCAVEQLQDKSFDARVYIGMGEVHGYVFLKTKALEDAKKCLELPNGTSLQFGVVDKQTAANVKKNAEKNVVNEEDNLDLQLRNAVNKYNATYTCINDHGTKLFNQRERSIDLLENVENLINSVANHPKEFDADFEDIHVEKKEFREVCEYAREELEVAQKSAASASAGIAGGMAVASLAPSAAMWVATTFGTASTGTAISALSGAAAQSAALAWLGGGAVAANGGGIVAGQALLALSGPIGWSIAGATLLTSIVLFANKKRKLDKDKLEEIESVLRNTESLNEIDGKLEAILEKTNETRSGLNKQYTKAMSCYGRDFLEIPEEEQMLLATIVNNAKALALSLSEGV